MPIYKYRSFEEAQEHHQQLLPSDPLARLLKLEKMITILKPPRKIQGSVFRFRTLEEANAHRLAQQAAETRGA